MQVFSSENCDIEILENGKTISNFIDDKIEERGSVVSIRDIMKLNFYILLIYNCVKSIVR